VPVIQLVGLAIIATAGTNAPRILPGVDIPLIVIAAVCAARLADPPGRRAPRRPAGRRAGDVLELRVGVDPVGVGDRLAGRVHGGLRAAVRAHRRRQRLDVQDDPALFRGEAKIAIADGEDATRASARARRLSGRRSGSSARSGRSVRPAPADAPRLAYVGV
jgi:hypothetical protein